MGKSIPELSHAARMLSQRIIRLEQDETLPYAEIDRIVGCDSRTNRHLIVTARHVAEREKGVVCEVVPKVGLRRMKADEIGNVGDVAMTRIRSTARRASRTIVRGIQATPPTGEGLTASLARLSVLGAIEHAIGEKKILAIEGEVKRRSEQLPLDDTIAFFRNGKA